MDLYVHSACAISKRFIRLDRQLRLILYIINIRTISITQKDHSVSRLASAVPALFVAPFTLLVEQIFSERSSKSYQQF
jgi:hypothetical protein